MDHRQHVPFEFDIDAPFGTAHTNPTRALAPFSTAAWAGASNLLDKAVRSLASGDRQRCSSLVDRAARLPYDDHEDAAPAALAGHMLLFSAIIDALETAPEDDDGWARAVVAVAKAAPREAAQELRHVLTAILQDYNLSGREAKLLRGAVAQLPERAELRDRGHVPPAELAVVVLQLVETTLSYWRELESAGSAGRPL